MAPLRTGFDRLDRFLQPSPFRPGRPVLLTGGFGGVVATRLCLDAATRGTVTLVDGGNAVNPGEMLHHARRLGLGTGFADRVRVARGFTAHQVTALLADRLPRQLDAAALCFLLEPDALFADDDLDDGEGDALLLHGLAEAAEAAARRGVPLLTLSRDPVRPDVLRAAHEDTVSFTETRNGIRVTLRGRSLDFDPGRHPQQAALNRFVETFGAAGARRLAATYQTGIRGFAGVGTGG